MREVNWTNSHQLVGRRCAHSNLNFISLFCVRLTLWCQRKWLHGCRARWRAVLQAGNYEPAEDPTRPQTLLDWVRNNLQPFETISLRSASRGHDTEEWKYKKKKQQNKTKINAELSQLQRFAARSTLVICCECNTEHLGRNRGCKICRWTSWWGVGCCWQAGWKKWWQVFTKWQLFWILSSRRSWADTFISGSLCLDADLSPQPLPPSFLWSQCSLLRHVSQRLRQNNPITILTQFFSFFLSFFTWLLAESASRLVPNRCQPGLTTLVHRSQHGTLGRCTG